MDLGVIIKAAIVWIGILLCAIANGALRTIVLIPQLGQLPSMVISGVLLSAVILVITYLALPWLHVRNKKHLLQIGLLWLAATVAFEFIFGLARGVDMETILAAYTFTNGDLWPAVLLVVALAPWMMNNVREHRS